jgi:uncharacterized membrane protein YuzA (DUF378 family)
MQKLSTLDIIALVLLIIGGLNWGIIGVLNKNVVGIVFGSLGLDNLIYILVGLSALYVAWLWMKLEKK